MVDNNLTEIVAIIDRSGSMQSLRADTIGGFNSFVAEQKKAKGKALLTLVQFDNQYQIDYEGKDISDVSDLNEETYVPRGSTALLDAVGRTVNAVGARLSTLPEEKRPGQIIFLIITDGQENCSKEFAAAKVKEMVKHQTDTYKWSFVFMGGGDIESQKDQGARLGFNSSNTYGYSPNAGGTKNLYASLSKGITRRREAQAAGVEVSCQASLLTEAEIGSIG
jgi:hypothetical protein